MVTRRHDTAVAGDRTYLGECGAVVVVVEPSPDGAGLPLHCSCGAQMCPEEEPTSCLARDVARPGVPAFPEAAPMTAQYDGRRVSDVLRAQLRREWPHADETGLLIAIDTA